MLTMARSKTGSFWLRETITIPANSADGTRVQAAMDLGSYIDVANSIALAVEQCDVVFQTGTDFGGTAQDMVAADASLSYQVTDLNPGTAFVRADDNSLIASGTMNVDDTNNVATSVADFYPDNYGKLDESFMVINTNLYCVAGIDSAALGTTDVYCTIMLKARLAKLEKADWVSLAIQNTASV
jgi:hypothetical protein